MAAGGGTIIAQAHARGGMDAVQQEFDTNEGLEIQVSWLAAVDLALKTGDVEGAQSMLAYRPAAARPFTPKWYVEDARMASKAAYQQWERQTHGWGELQVPPNNLIPSSGARQRRPPKDPKGPKAKTPKPTVDPKTGKAKQG